MWYQAVIILCLCFNSSLFLSAFAQQPSDVLMQGFYWNAHPGDITLATDGVWWDTVATVAPELSHAGFQMVWLPPPSKGMSGVYDMGYGLYDYYDLGAINQKGIQRTRFGTRAELEQAISTLHAQGLEVMADLVLNHRAGADAQQSYDCGSGTGWFAFTPLSGRFPGDSTHFHPNQEHCDTNPPYHSKDFFEDICYFRDWNTILDPSQPNNGWYNGPHTLGKVGDSLIVWGRWLINEIGFDAVRMDAVKHIEPGFIAPFLVELRSSPQPFAIGEFFDSDLSKVRSWYDDVVTFNGNQGNGAPNASVAFFDFNLRYALRDLCNSSTYNLANLNDAGMRFYTNPFPPEAIVTFAENHDVDRIGWVVTNSSDPDAIQYGNTYLKLETDSGHDPIFKDKHLAYAYIMAAEGKPMVFWKDYFWYGLADEIKWLITLRRYTAGGASTPMNSLNPVFPSGGTTDDLFVLQRAGNSTVPGNMLALNDHATSTLEVWVNTPFTQMELRDYSDAHLFESTYAYGDSRALLKAFPRNYAWYAPTGLYPHPPDEPASAFTLEAQPGGKLQYLVLRADDASQFTVNGAPIETGDEIAVIGPSNLFSQVAGIGRIGQSFRWDGVHDMIIEVLGGANSTEAKGGLLEGSTLQLVVYDQSAGKYFAVSSITYAPTNTTLSFSAKRPASRGGSTPFTITTSSNDGKYHVGTIAQITAFQTATTPLPIELSSFEAFVERQEVLLRWETQTESQNAGFEIQQATEANPSFQTIAFVEGAGVSSTPRAYTYKLGPLAPGNYRFRLKQIDFDGSITYSPTIEVTILTQQAWLAPPYPNPADTYTTIQWASPSLTNISLTLYDLQGRKVKQLFQGKPEQAHSLQKLNIPTGSLAAGQYLIILQTPIRTLYYPLVVKH